MDDSETDLFPIKILSKSVEKQKVIVFFRLQLVFLDFFDIFGSTLDPTTNCVSALYRRHGWHAAGDPVAGEREGSVGVVLSISRDLEGKRRGGQRGGHTDVRLTPIQS